jgi:iron complex outermembrane receptor protein
MKKFIKIIFLIALIINLCNTQSIGKEANDDINNLSLEEMLNTPISAAAKYEQKAKNAAASITIITSEDIKRYGYKTLFDAMQSVVGFFGRDTRNYTEMGVRGIDRPSDYGNKILLLLNGHTYNDNFYGAAVYGNDFGIDMSIVDRIEIVMGPTSALYGTGAMLAVINVITDEGSNFDKINIKTNIGNFGHKKVNLNYGEKLKNDFEFMISGSYGYSDGEDIYIEEFDSPETNNGISKGIDWEKYYNTFVKINYKNFTFQGNLSNREKSIPNASYLMDFNDGNAVSTDKRGFIELQYDLNIDETKRLSARIFYDEYYYDGFYPYTEDSTYSILKDKNICEWTGAEVKLIWDMLVSNRLIIGSEIYHSFQSSYKEWDENGINFNKNFPHTIYSIYLQDEFQILSNLSVIGGLRYDNYSHTDNILSPRLALVYNLKKYSTLKALYGQAYRAPNNSELFYQSDGQAKANHSINGEYIKSAEIIYEQKILSYFQFSGSLFWNYLDNMIQQELDTSDNLLQFRNIGKFQTQGLALELKARSDQGYWGYINYTFQNAKDINTDIPLSNSPAHLFKTGFSMVLYKYLYSGIEFYYESGRNSLSNEEYSEKKLPAVFLTNLNFSYQPDYAKTSTMNDIMNRLKLSFKIRNLFDLDYKLPVGFDNLPVQSIQQRKRELLFTLSVNLR